MATITITVSDLDEVEHMADYLREVADRPSRERIHQRARRSRPALG